MIKLFINCKIETIDKENSIAEAMSIYQDKILSIGKENDVRNETKDLVNNFERSIKIKEIDLEGAYIVPGFIDTHLHPIVTIYFNTQLNLSAVKSYDELGKILKQEHNVRDKDEWIIAFDLMEQNFIDPNERTFPDRYKLDELCPERALIIFRYDGHICSVNSLALKEMNIDKEHVNDLTFESGEVQLDADGNPSGVFTEGATSFALDNAPIPSMERFKEASKKFNDELSSYGITTCGAIVQGGELGIAGKAGRMEVPFLKYLIKENQIEQDFAIFIVTDRPKKLNQISRGISKIIGDSNKITVAGIKLFADGSFGAFTAYMYKPFSDSPEGKTGLVVTEQERLIEIFKETYDLGYHAACHAIGDRANQMVVDVYREVLRDKEENNKINKSIRLRIEHASLVNEKILKEAADLGIIFSCQPNFINSEYTWLEKRLGPERVKFAYPFRSIIDAGIMLAGASDAPIEPADVLKGIQASVTRNGFIPDEAITPYEALRVYTYNAAYAIGQESIKGSLEKGKLADFVVLEQDIASVQPDKISEIKILRTYHRGRKIYQLN